MGASQSTNELYAIHGDLPSELLPIAANQALIPGEPIYLVNGAVTRWIAVGGTGSASQPFYGWIDQPTVKTLNGVSVDLAAGTLVKVIPAHKNVCWVLPSYGTAPVLATHLVNGANTTGFSVKNDGGTYKANLSDTSNPVVRPYSMDLEDARGNTGGQVWKSTFVVGDRLRCAILPAAKQVDF